MRRVLGPQLFHAVGRYYSRMFGDYRKIAPIISAAIPSDARVLDIGGGDGAPLNHILRDRPDISVTMIDIAPTIGGAIQTSLRRRVRVLPSITLRDYCGAYRSESNAVLILDVIHHIPPSQRTAFFADLHALVRRSPRPLVIVKDVEPDGSLSARINYLADRYISNDRDTSPIAREDLLVLLRKEFDDDIEIQNTELYSVQPPHYALILKPKSDSGST